MRDEILFLSGKYAKFYQISNSPKETRFLVEPETPEAKSFVEQMNGSLSLLHQHMRLQQYKTERFIPKVMEYDAETGSLILAISANLTSAVPTVMLDYNNIIIDIRHAAWITKQAFQLASLAHGAGIVLSFSTENFLVCYQSESFVLLDWTATQVYKKCRIDDAVAKEQVIDLANLLLSMVDYTGAISGKVPGNRCLIEFMNEAAGGAFLSATDATQRLNSILG